MYGSSYDRRINRTRGTTVGRTGAIRSTGLASSKVTAVRKSTVTTQKTEEKKEVVKATAPSPPSKYRQKSESKSYGYRSHLADTVVKSPYENSYVPTYEKSDTYKNVRDYGKSEKEEEEEQSSKYVPVKYVSTFSRGFGSYEPKWSYMRSYSLSSQERAHITSGKLGYRPVGL